jgi:copper homeostasis protein (lipoprotein)
MRTPSMGCTLLFTLTLTLAAGCASSGLPEPQAPAAAVRMVPPVTYTGRLPCADCPGIQLTVTLFPDSTFRLRQVYQDRPEVFHNLGRWSVEENGSRLVLRGGTVAPRFSQIVGADSLRMLDHFGRPTQSNLNHWLVRATQVDPVRDTMWLRSTYIYLADAGRFTECLSGKRGQPGPHDLAARQHATRSFPGRHPRPTHDRRAIRARMDRARESALRV